MFIPIQDFRSRIFIRGLGKCKLLDPKTPKTPIPPAPVVPKVQVAAALNLYPQVLATLHSFPSLRPTSVTTYPSEFLDVRTRRDILHRAVIYEADAARQGSASTKTRAEVKGSNRKIRRQKGSGKARLGDSRSPMLRHVFGPKPRSFATRLQRKVYQLAFRTALSVKYKQGNLIVLENHILKFHGWTKENGKVLFITDALRRNITLGMRNLGMHGIVKLKVDLQIHDLLKYEHVIIERKALDWLQEKTIALRDNLA